MAHPVIKGPTRTVQLSVPRRTLFQAMRHRVRTKVLACLAALWIDPTKRLPDVAAASASVA